MDTAKLVAIVAASIILFSTFYSVSAQAEAPTASSPAGDVCANSLLNMSDCLSYVMAGSNDTKPVKECCPELAGLLDSNPICLCELLGSNVTESYGIKIDLKRALKLPSVCGLQTPPLSTCAAVGYPVPGPVGAPTASENSIAPGAQSPGAATPLPGNDGNGVLGSTLAFTIGLGIAFLPTLF